MSQVLRRIVTPGFIAFNAHCWFAYAILATFPAHWVVVAAILGAGVKEFYIDKHFEVSQDFTDNLKDFAGYLAGITLQLWVRKHL